MPHWIDRDIKQVGTLFLTLPFLAELGIIDFGYTEDPESSSFDQYKNWVANKYNAEMSYLEGEKQDKRQNLKNYFPEYQSSFTFLFDYRRDKKKLDTFDSKRKVGGYTFGFSGEDYHYHIWESLDKICSLHFSELTHKVVVDTAPVLDRDLAYRSGLGWFGKNSMLINRHVGSYFMIGHILLDKKFNVSILPMDTDHCGQCRKCIDACPTDAIIEDSRTVDSNKCIPFFTIEKFKDDTFLLLVMIR